MAIKESISSLKLRLQKARDEELMYAWYVTRHFSIFITRLFLMTPITANQVTLLMIFFGSAGAFFFALNGIWPAIVGALLYQFSYVLDCSDGEVARYKNQSSTTGVYIDFVAHVVINQLILIGLTYHSYNQLQKMWVVWVGFFAVCGLVWLEIAKVFSAHRAIIERLQKNLKDAESATLGQKFVNTDIIKLKGAQRNGWKYQMLYQFYDMLGFPIMMNVVCIVSLADRFVSTFTIIRYTLTLESILLCVYAVGYIGLGTIFFTWRIRRRHVDFMSQNIWTRIYNLGRKNIDENIKI
jgi:phosphatidylglycerophosphate synthase